MDMTGTVTIVILASILIAAAMLCRLGERGRSRADASAPPRLDLTRRFRDPPL